MQPEDAPKHRRTLLRPLLWVSLAAVAGAATAVSLVIEALAFPAPLPPPPTGVVFSDVHIHVPGEPVRRHQRVVVSGDRIAEIGPAEPGATDRFAGATLMPGFNDLHVHWPPPALPSQARLFALLHLRHGVTAVRSMGDNFEGASTGVRDAVARGDWAGPRVLSCGPFVDGDPPLWRGSQIVRSPDDAQAAVDAIADAGFDCVKAYDELDEDSAIALREAAHARGLPIVGHTPRAALFERVAFDDAQHLRGLHPKQAGERVADYPFFLSAWLEADAAHLQRITELSLELGTAHTPTLVTIDRLIASRHPEQLRAEPVYDWLPRWYIDALWDPHIGLNAARLLDADDFDMVEAAFARMQQAVGHMHAAGVPIHVGTDTLAPAVVPGAAYHRELTLLVESGLTPEAALEASTVTGARALGIDGLGEIRPGAPAELVIFARDPAGDLAALESIAGVVRGGRLYSREDLDARIGRFSEVFETRMHRERVTGVLRALLGDLLPMLYSGPTDANEARTEAEPS